MTTPFKKPLMIFAAILLCGASAAPRNETSRVKDLVSIEVIRDNQLIGYGLVVGLNGTGDTLENIPFTRQSLSAMLERLGVDLRGQEMRTGNVAAAMVTANLPPFGVQGTRFNVTVSAIGDAKSLEGGTLLITQLLGADGNVYAVAQGTLSGRSETGHTPVGIPTVGQVADGATVEREVEFELNSLSTVRLVLRAADFTSAICISFAINQFLECDGSRTEQCFDRQGRGPKQIPQERGHTAR